MKITTTLLGSLAKSMPGATTTEPGDSSISVPPVYLNSGLIPFPILRLHTAPTGTELNGSSIITDQANLAASTAVTLIQLGEGLWHCQYELSLEQGGAVADVTSSGELQIAMGGVSGSPVTVGRIRNLLEDQVRRGEFFMSVNKTTPVAFNRITTAGAGTGTGFLRTCLILLRLL